MIKAKSVILDPTGVYPVPNNCIAITTEMEWLTLFAQDSCCYQIKGDSLCKWTREWLGVWQKTQLIIEEKQKPTVRLQTLFPNLFLSSDWTEEKVLGIVTKLEYYEQDNPIAHLLTEITQDDLWFEKPSFEHLYRWLAVEVPREYQDFEKLWLSQIKDQAEDLSIYYQTEDKVLLLKRLLGLASPVLEKFPYFPQEIPACLSEEFHRFWQTKILDTKAEVLNQLVIDQEAGIKVIATSAYKVFLDYPQWLSKDKLNRILPFLEREKINELKDLEPPPQPELLTLDSSSDEVFRWVTKEYLPYRRWAVVINKSVKAQKISDNLAASFVQWIAKYYPQLKLDSVCHSTLNYNVTTQVLELCKTNPVFWVVVDGLGWLDHQELLSILRQNYEFSVETELQPRFSILPTKTEYAKWSLYTQKLPSDSSWVNNSNDLGKAFSVMGIGARYTDRKKPQLTAALKENKHQLYCWDTDELDHLYHQEKDFDSLYHTKRITTIEGIARSIKYYVEQHPSPETLKIVIASDHGQMIGGIPLLREYPSFIEPKGRMAIGKFEHPDFIFLDPARYDLPHEISVVKGAACLNSFHNNSKGEVIGSHGGLFPEEVVIGFSVLSKVVERLPVKVICQGKGVANKPIDLQVTIVNPNTVSLTNLLLYIDELPSLKKGISLKEEIPPKDQVTLRVTVHELPQLSLSNQSDQINLTGKMIFRFADSELANSNLDANSVISLEKIFESGMNIDEFF